MTNQFISIAQMAHEAHWLYTKMCVDVQLRIESGLFIEDQMNWERSDFDS